MSLVELAVPLFIYAATVCQFVGTKGRNTMTYLNKALDYKKSTFSQLDGTYLPALDQLLNEQKDEKEEWLNELKEVVGSIVVLESPLSVTSLACLFQISREEVKCRLDSLHSVLSIPNSEDVPIRCCICPFASSSSTLKNREGTHFGWTRKAHTTSFHLVALSLCLAQAAFVKMCAAS
jgi:hypothetical protein